MTKDTAHTPQLVGMEEARIAIFGTGKEAPSKRTWAEWKSRGFYPYHRIGGKRIFIDVEEAKRALSRRFKIEATEA